MSVARLVLVGLPGTGKSTLARELAQRWDCASLDTDAVLAELVGEPAASYLREAGEAAFRERELDALRLALRADAVVATGAGVVVTPAGRALLKGARTLWLDAANEILLDRLADGDRPLLGADHATALARLRGEREALYREVTRQRVDASGTPEDVCRSVLKTVGGVVA